MNRRELARLLDHSLLKPEATEEEILAQVDVVRQWGIGFFCVQASYVSLAAGALSDSGARVVSVVGFPHGCDRSTVKAHAAELAVRDGAVEVDMVMNVGRLKSGRSQAVADEIAQVVTRDPRHPGQGHPRDVPAHRGGEGRGVSHCAGFGRGVREDSHRISSGGWGDGG